MSKFAKLAKNAISEYLKSGRILAVPRDLPPEFYERNHGVFVSLHRGKELRGCIGTYLPAHDNLAEEIISNAVAACSKDNRFEPITAEELPALSVEASLLGSPEKISDVSGLDPKKFGVIAKCPDGRCGLLLPGIEGVDSAGQQLSIACRKGGINPAVDRNLEIYRFTAEKHSE